MQSCRQVGGDDHVFWDAAEFQGDDEVLFVGLIECLEDPEHEGECEKEKENQELPVPEFGIALPDETKYHSEELFVESSVLFGRFGRRPSESLFGGDGIDALFGDFDLHAFADFEHDAAGVLIDALHGAVDAVDGDDLLSDGE